MTETHLPKASETLAETGEFILTSEICTLFSPLGGDSMTSMTAFCSGFVGFLLLLFDSDPQERKALPIFIYVLVRKKLLRRFLSDSS